MNRIFLADFKELLGDIGAKIFPSLPALITQLLATFVMFFIVFKFFWKPIKEFIDKRKDFLEKELKEATNLKEEAEANHALADKRIKEMKIEARKIKEEAENQALELRKEILLKAEEEAQAKKDKALRDIEKQKLEAKEDIHREIVGVALLAAQKIVEREIDEKDNTRLVEDFIKDVKN